MASRMSQGKPDADVRMVVHPAPSQCPASARPVIAGARSSVARAPTGVVRDGPYRVLIVDDDPAQALFAQAILRHAGMETRVLGGPLPVLAELERFQPDLLLLDFNLPDCDGFELTARIRAREGHGRTQIVFLSGELDEDRRRAALDAGADDFLGKPIHPAHLIAYVTERVRCARAAAAVVPACTPGAA